MTTYQTKHQTMRQKRLAVKQWLIGTTFRCVLLTSVAVFGIMYVVQTSSISTKGYEINDLEGQIQVLEQENQKLEFEIATHRSMKSIQERLDGLGLVMADRVDYATLVGTAVARR